MLKIVKNCHVWCPVNERQYRLASAYRCTMQNFPGAMKLIAIFQHVVAENVRFAELGLCQ
jgi:hypothetical protein